METLVSLFLDTVERYKKKNALYMRPQWRAISWSFEELGNFARGMAYQLNQFGVEQGDRVILISPNMPQWPGSFFGILLNGAVVVPLNPQSTPAFVESICQQTGAKVILKHSGIALEPPLNIQIINIDHKEYFAHQNWPSHHKMPMPGDIAEIVYTSGTTGDPKGVVLTHANIVSNLKAIEEVFVLEKHDATVSVLPLFHMFEQTADMCLALFNGVPVMYTPALSARAIQDCLQQQRATKMAMVPEMLETIARRIEQVAEEQGRGDFFRACCAFALCLPYWMRRLIFFKIHRKFGGKLRLIVSGGAALPIEVEKRWNAFGIHVLQGYGLTEASPVVSTNTIQHHRLGSVGKVINSVHVDIAADGELLVSGESVFAQYYRDEQKTKQAFDEQGRYKTGDLGYFDEDGYLFLHGRKKYVIVGPSGENVYPEDIEAVLKLMPGIIDASVIGRVVHGREIVYAVLLGDILNPQEIIDAANKELAPYQHIRGWTVWPDADFPRSATRKVRKEEVRARLEAMNSQHMRRSHKDPATPLMRIVATVTGVPLESITTTTNLVQDTHMDSLMRIELVSAIEEHFNVVLDEHAITEKTTVSDLEAYILKAPSIQTQRSARTWPLAGPVVWLRWLLQYIFVFPIVLFRIRVNVRGLEHIESLNTPFILMPNHLSYIDTILILWALPSDIRRKIAIAAALDVLYKQYWWAVSFLEFLFNTFPFPRKENENIKPGFQACGEALDRGFNILVFPEGKISETGALLPLKQGAGLLATQMKAPVIPVFLNGVRAVIGEEQIIPRHSGSVTVTFGAPLVFEPATPYTEATARIQQAMEQLVEKQ